MFTINDLVNRLMAIDGTKAENFEGCTEEEIQALMKDQNVSSLPKIYIEFLSRLGKKTGKSFLGGEDIRGHHIVGIQEVLMESLEEFKIDWEIPENIFVFWTHNGYEFYYFYVNEGDDPPVYYLAYNMQNPRKISETLSQLFEWLLKQYEDVIRQSRKYM